MPFIEDLGQQAAQGILGGAMGLMLQRSNDRRQYNQQERLQGLQIRGQQQMMDYAYQKQMEMWNNTNYGAQLAHMKAAGLSPGLMYGMKGGGGITVGQPSGNVQGANAPVGGQEIPQMMGMGIQLAMMKAQQRVLETQADKNAAEAERTAGSQTDLDRTTIASLTQGIENQKALKAFTEVQTAIERIKERIAYITENSAIEMISSTAREAMASARIAEVNKWMTEETARDKVAIVHTELIKLGLENALIEAQTTTEKGKPAVQQAEIKLMDRQGLDLIRQGVQRWWDIEIRGSAQKTAENKAAHEAWVNDISNSMKLPIETVEKIIQAVMIKEFLRPRNMPTTRGFHDRDK